MMAGYFVVECLIFNGSEWLQESKPSLAKMLEGEAYAPKCLPGAECGLDGLVILALDQGLHTPVVVRYHMLSHVGVWNCDGGFILIHDKFTGGISMIHNDIPHLWTNPNQRNQGFRWHGYWVYCRGCCEQTDDDVWEESARFCDPSLDRTYSHMAHGAFPEAWRGTRAFKIDRSYSHVDWSHLWSYVFLILDGDIRSSSRYRHCH